MYDFPKYVETPLMKQYYNIKTKHPDAILLFRVGDFYETFGEDAIRTSEILALLLRAGQTDQLLLLNLQDFRTMPSTSICLAW